LCMKASAHKALIISDCDDYQIDRLKNLAQR
jgi:hypothetical protein